MLPLIGKNCREASERIVALHGRLHRCAQTVMIPVALAAGTSRARGRKAVFLIGFAALPIRGALIRSPTILISVAYN